MAVVSVEELRAAVRNHPALLDAWADAELAERVDISLANLSILKTGKAKAIRFSTLEAICKVLACQPGDLLAYDANGVRADGDADEGAAS